MTKPLTVIIFGATGDLFRRKLAGALFDLFQKGMLPKQTEIIGFSRKPFSHDQFRAFIHNTLALRASARAVSGGIAIEPEDFVSHAFYHEGDLTSQESYESLGRFLEERDRERGLCSDKLFYLAVPPNLYEKVFLRLSKSGLTVPCAPGVKDEDKAWTRVLVEKPFGNNEKEASRLDRILGTLFEEDQIFRIDHYLAKEAIQNILSFRFSNGLFEPLWNSRYIERIVIKMHEKDGAEGRGQFYDSVGALRDVGQNHLLQMLALVAMENPGLLSAKQIRGARLKVLEKISIRAGSVSDSFLRGQYEGFKKESGIASESQTETFFRLTAVVKNKKWNGVPFILESGKAMAESLVEIDIFFKAADCLCPSSHDKPHQNVISFNIFPKEEISVLFWAKKPGFEFGLLPKKLSFSFSGDDDLKRLPDAYERVLFDCIRGDQTLFTSTLEVKAQWKFISRVLDRWNGLPLTIYKKGSNTIV